MKTKFEKWQDVPKYVIVKHNERDDVLICPMPNSLRKDAFNEFKDCETVDYNELAKYWGFTDSRKNETVIFGMKLNYC